MRCRNLIPVLTLWLVLAGLAGAQVDELGHQLATLTETYGTSLVTVVRESETTMRGPLAMFGGGGNEPQKTRVIGVVVGENLIISPRMPKASGAGPLGGLLERIGQGLELETEELGTYLLAPDGEEYDVELQGDDELLGVAFWSVVGEDRPELTPVTFPVEPRLQLGEPVVGLAPLGRGYTRSITWMRSRVNAIKETPHLAYFTELPTGGPGTLVVNAKGAPVGMLLPDIDVESIDLETIMTALTEGLAPIFPADHFAALIADPPRKGDRGTRQQPWLPITMAPVPPVLAQAMGLPTESGIQIASVYRGQPGSGVGMRPEDVITAVNGESLGPIEKQEDLEVLLKKINRMRVGDTVTLDLWRRGETLQVRVPLGPRPMDREDAPAVEDKQFELEVRELTFWDRDERNLPDDFQGVVVKEVERAGWAGIGKVSKGDIILRIGEDRIDDVQAFSAALARVKQRKPEKVIFYVQKGLDTRFLEIKPSWEGGLKEF